ncbi:MAG: LUD domain-containing protein [Bacteroidota bacterium]
MERGRTSCHRIFHEHVERHRGKVFIIDDPESIREHVLETHGDGKRIVNQFSLLDWKNFDNVKYEPAGSLERIEVAIIEGDMGVAENGAIWVDGNSLGHRALPFICQHLVIVLSESKIVSTLHQAYSKINVRESGFGTFIAGPSKTADIEQSLVIGAHGARSMTAFVMRGK